MPQSSHSKLARIPTPVAVLALAIAVALGVTPALAGTNDRFVLRHLVEPPLDLRAYASPLMGYRYLETDQKTITQFTTSGLPTGAHLRVRVRLCEPPVPACGWQ